MNNKQLIQNAGQRIIQNQKTDAYIRVLCEEYMSADQDDPELLERIQGQIDAFLFSQSATHMETVEKVVQIKKIIRDIDDSEYFDFELSYLQGYLSALETALSINRALFAERIPYVLILCCADPDILEKYTLALRCRSGILPYPSDAEVQYLTVSAIDEAVERLESMQTADCECGEGPAISLLVLYAPGNAPAFESVSRLQTVNPKQVHFIQDTPETNASKILKKILSSVGMY